MSVSDTLILFWLLPSLITAQGLIIYGRYNYETLEDIWDKNQIHYFLILVLLYPVSRIAFVFMGLVPFLVKERSFKLNRKM
jgi:uncharacterized membrane protein